MRKPAFTLIETLIALAIVIVVMGATISANRVIQISSQITAERTQMSALVDESVSMLQLFQRQAQTATQQLGDASVFNLPALNSSNTSKKVIFYADATAAYTSPITEKVCLEASADPCQSEKSPVHIGSSALTVSQMFASTDIAGELVAVRRTPAADRQILSMTNRLATDSNGVADVNSAADIGIWDFYTRQILVTRLGTSGTWYGQTINGGHTQAQALNAVYQITITVSKYLTPSVAPMTRTIILTDN